MMPSDEHLRIDQWQVLRNLLPGPLTVGGLASRLSRAPNSVSRSLETLQGRGLVEFKPEHEHTAPNKPKGRWTLTGRGASVAKKAPAAASPMPASPLTRVLDDEESELADLPVGRLERHQGFVVTTVESQRVPELLEVLAAGEQGIEASFVARLDGDAHGYLFVFDSRLGARPPEVLSAALAEAQLPFTTGVVADVRDFSQLVGDARATRNAARRVRSPRPAMPD
jgi:DNA-binding MarR family transcriptional regulator